MAPMDIPDGYELLVGRGKEQAIKALAIAEDRGIDPTEVRVSPQLGGFLIPKGDSAEPDGAAEEVAAPKETDTHDVIDQFAADNGISLDGIEAANPEKPTKAEKIAAITKALEAKADGADQKGE